MALSSGARELPLSHLSIRVPWHDAGWDGTVCRRPRDNSSCLILKKIGANKDDGAESACSGNRIDQLPAEQRPPCASERVTFMSPFDFSREAMHPYAAFDDNYKHFKPTPFRHTPYSAACIPFRWMLRSYVEGESSKPGQVAADGLAERLRLGYQPDREPDLGRPTSWIQERQNQLAILDTFFSAVRPDSSLCFFYAKRTPLAEDPRRVIVGVGRVLQVSEAVEYQYSQTHALRCVLWERNVTHSIRPGFLDGFVFPYQELLAHAREHDIDLSACVAFAPDAHFEEFSYATAHVSHDGAIAGLLACYQALQHIQAHLPGPWDKALAWIDQQINRTWRLRGPCPGFGSALSALGFPHGNLIAYEIAATLAREGQEGADPWPVFEELLRGKHPLARTLKDELGTNLPKAYLALGKERLALLKLLSRFNLSAEQATRYYQPTERAKHGITLSDADLLQNAYVLYEADRKQSDAIPLSTIDHGLFPDPQIQQQHPLPAPSALEDAIDWRRARAHLIDELERAASDGHTLQPRDQVIQAIRDRELRPSCPLSVDLIGPAEQQLSGLLRSVTLDSGAPAYQLEHLFQAGTTIRDSVTRRRKGKRHAGEHPWRAALDAHLSGDVSTMPDADLEERARTEKAAALKEIFQSRLSVLIGPAGTGKTTLLKALCSIASVQSGGVLLLAPTGKARVRMEQQIGKLECVQAKTIAQFLLQFHRYDGKTGRYFQSPQAPQEAGFRTVIIDECSMLTEEQLAATLEALQGVERLLLVGDPRQLPPIGSGRPFLDIVQQLEPEDIEARFPRVATGYAELTIPRRQTGALRDDLGLASWFSGRALAPAADEVWQRLAAGEASGITAISWRTPEELEQKLLQALEDELPRILREAKRSVPQSPEARFECSIGGTPFPEGSDQIYFNCQGREHDGAASMAEAWQILSAVRGELHGVDALNRTLQARYRRRVLELTQQVFYRRRVPSPFGGQGILYGDKVISVRNGSRRDFFAPGRDREPLYIANGDIGVAVGQYKGRSANYKSPPWKLEVEFLSQAGVKVDYKKWEFSEDGDAPLELAYALTVHKAQGSEFGTTFVVIPNPCRPLSRELLYTALTRQRGRIFLLHQGPLQDLHRYTGSEFSDTARRLTNLFRAPRPVPVDTLRCNQRKVGRRDRFLEDRLIHRTRRGDLVRSKSEVILADLFFGKGHRHYVYEQRLEVPDGSSRIPDFTFHDAEAGRTIFWEHLGMLDRPDYRANWEKKRDWYRAQGILTREEDPDADPLLVISQDGPGGSIDVQSIERLIDEVL